MFNIYIYIYIQHFKKIIPYFKKKYCKLIAKILSKQQKLDADPKPMQQIHFTGDLHRTEGSSIFFIIEERNSFRFF